MFFNFGGVPCIIMGTLKIRPLSHTISNVKSIIPIKPTHGCQFGIPAGAVSLNSIRVGVKGGISDIIVEKLAKEQS